MALNMSVQRSAVSKKKVFVATSPTQQASVKGEFVQVSHNGPPNPQLLSQEITPVSAPTPKTSPGQRLVSSYQKLSSANSVLKNEITSWHASIRVFNDALSKLQLGVSGWYTLSSGEGDEDEPTSHWSRQLGWSHHSGKWQICLKKVWGDYSHPDDDREEVWAFEDAPQWLQLDAGAKLQELVDVLVQRTEELTKRVAKRKAETAAMITDFEARLIFGDPHPAQSFQMSHEGVE